MQPGNNVETKGTIATKEVASGGGISIIANVLGQLFRLIFQVLLSRMLGAHGYGLFSLGRSVLEIALRVALLGFQNSVIRYIPIYTGRLDLSHLKGLIRYASLIVVLMSFVVAVTMGLSSTFVADEVFNETEMSEVLYVFSLTLPIYALFTFIAFCTRGLKQMKYYSGMLEVVHPLLLILFVGVFLYHGYGLNGALYGFLVATLIALLIIVYLFRTSITEKLMGYQSAHTTFEASSIFHYSISVFFLGFAQIVLGHTDRIMLGWLSVGADVGMYVAASLLAQKVAFFQGAFNGIFAPVLSGMYHDVDHRDSISLLFKTVTKWTQLLTLPLVIVLLFMGDRILLLFGKEFIQAWHILFVLTCSQLVNIIVGPVGYMLVMTGKQNVEFYNSLIMGIINILLNLLMIPLYGALGAAMATAISIATINIIRLYQVHRLIGCHPFKKSMYIPIGTIIMLSILWYFLQYIFTFGMLSEIIILVFVIIVYFLICYKYALDDADDDLLIMMKNKLSTKKNVIVPQGSMK